MALVFMNVCRLHTEHHTLLLAAIVMRFTVRRARSACCATGLWSGFACSSNSCRRRLLLMSMSKFWRSSIGLVWYHCCSEKNATNLKRRTLTPQTFQRTANTSSVSMLTPQTFRSVANTSSISKLCQHLKRLNANTSNN